MRRDSPIILDCRFLCGAASPHGFPEDDRPEVAFVGRSNAGKSSALNLITGRRQLARVSKTPGRTQQINFFDCNGNARLVDLPGYGFARVPPAVQKQWRVLIESYLVDRNHLRGLVVVMDARRPLTDLDKAMLEFANVHGRPCHVLLTKADKLSRGAAANMFARASQAFQAYPQTGGQLFSALKRTGVEEARAVVAAWLSRQADI